MILPHFDVSKTSQPLLAIVQLKQRATPVYAGLLLRPPLSVAELASMMNCATTRGAAGPLLPFTWLGPLIGSADGSLVSDCEDGDIDRHCDSLYN
jgi:hypothetical protein